MWTLQQQKAPNAGNINTRHGKNYDKVDDEIVVQLRQKKISQGATIVYSMG